MKKEYLISWELHNYGTSKIKANSRKEAEEIAEETILEEQDFEEDYFNHDWQDAVWKVVKVEEMKEVI